MYAIDLGSCKPIRCTCYSVLQRVAACCSVLQRVVHNELLENVYLQHLRQLAAQFIMYNSYSIYYVQIRLHSLYKFATQFTTYRYDSIHYTNLLLNLLRTNTTPFTIQICYSIHYITPTFTIQICYSIYYVQIRLHSQYKFATQFTI